jgi:hypothetical protein
MIARQSMARVQQARSAFASFASNTHGLLLVKLAAAA